MKVMRMSRPELLCGILVNSFRLQILVSLNSLHGICFARRSQPNNAKGSQLVKVMRMSRPELLCGIPVHSFRLHLLVSLNSLHGICFARRSQPIAALLRQSAVNDVQLYM
jgi:hypothetical protein